MFLIYFGSLAQLTIGFKGLSYVWRLEEYTAKNSECVIFIEYKQKWYQKYYKEGKKWKQLSRNGTLRECTPEQLLSHILPPLAGSWEPQSEWFQLKKSNSSRSTRQDLLEIKRYSLHQIRAECGGPDGNWTRDLRISSPRGLKSPPLWPDWATGPRFSLETVFVLAFRGFGLVFWSFGIRSLIQQSL